MNLVLSTKRLKCITILLFILQGHTTAARDDSPIQDPYRGHVDKANINNLVRRSNGNCGNPNRYVSRTYSLNILTLTQKAQQATTHSEMEGSIPSMRMVIRHPKVTTRQLLPRDIAFIHPEIKDLDTPHRPTHVSFLVLSPEITSSETEEGALGLPICHATWDFPNLDAFYDVLQQVVDLLEPAHRRP